MFSNGLVDVSTPVNTREESNTAKVLILVRMVIPQRESGTWASVSDGCMRNQRIKRKMSRLDVIHLLMQKRTKLMQMKSI